MVKDWADDPDFKAYAQHVRGELIPMIQDSGVTIALVPPDNVPDVKFAVELGYMIMLDKPIIAVIPPGSTPPAKLVLVADELVEGPVDGRGFQTRLLLAMSRVAKKG